MAVLGLAAGGCGMSRVTPVPSGTSPGGGASTVAAGRSAPSFLTLEIDNITRLLQLRRLSDVRAPTTVISSDQFAGAIETSTTSALVGLSSNCNATLERVNLITGDVRVLRRLHQAVSGFALSPNGAELAYITYAHCSVPPPCPGVCSGGTTFGPDTLAVLNLSTGAVSETTLVGPDPHPVVAQPSWSPNGRQVAVSVLEGTPAQVAVVNAAHPEFRTARLLPRPAGCDDDPIAWTTLGILTDESCGDGTPTSVTHFMAVTDTGKTTRRWAVPPCTYGVSAEQAADSTKIVVDTDVGYGTCSPQATWTAQFWTIDGPKLKPLFAIPGAGFDVGLP